MLFLAAGSLIMATVLSLFASVGRSRCADCGMGRYIWQLLWKKMDERYRSVMQQYSVLLVDDEEDVIRVIMKKIDWERMGFTVIGYAHNGVEALEMVEECVPDVVLTDIKMPYMDGLAISRKLKERYQTYKNYYFFRL